MDASQLQESAVRVHRAVTSAKVSGYFVRPDAPSKVAGYLCIVGILLLTGCASLPDTHFQAHSFPKDAYVGDVKDRPYDKLGLVKTRVDYTTLDANNDEAFLCRNYFNKGASDLLKIARKQGGDAIVDVRSVVFYEDGKSSTFQEPECSDDGQDGQILMEGIAVKWRKDPTVEAPADPGVAPAPVAVTKAPHAVLSKDWPFLQSSSQRYRSLALKKGEDGIDGGIRVMSDPNRIVLFTMDRKILDVQPSVSRRLWLTAEFLRSSSARSILLSEQQPLGAAVGTLIYDLHAGKLEIESWVDPATGNADHLKLRSGPNAAWRLTEAEPHDILQVIAQPDVGEVTFVRYHFAGEDQGWLKSMRAEAGTWKTGQSFPSEDRFPAAAASSAQH